MNVIIMKLHKVAAERITIQSKFSFTHSTSITAASELNKSEKLKASQKTEHKSDKNKQ